MENKQTALSQLLEWVKDNQTTFDEIDSFGDVYPVTAVPLIELQSKLTELLEVEKGQIETAYGWGMVDIVELLQYNLNHVDMAQTNKEIEKFKAGEPDEKAQDYFTKTYGDGK